MEEQETIYVELLCLQKKDWCENDEKQDGG